MEHSLSLRTIGFVSCLLITLGAYFVIINPEYVNLSIKGALITIYSLAFLQATVQFLFFLDIWRETGIRWNLGVFLSTISLIFVIVFFSIWIMDHLNYNMMP